MQCKVPKLKTTKVDTRGVERASKLYGRKSDIADRKLLFHSFYSYSFLKRVASEAEKAKRSVGSENEGGWLQDFRIEPRDMS